MSRTPPLPVLLLIGLALAVPMNRLDAQGWPGRGGLETEACRPDAGASDPAAWLAHARAATGLATVAGERVQWHGHATDVQYFQSDRPYPPYLHAVSEQEWTWDPGTGVERTERTGIATLTTDHATFFVRDTAVLPVPQAHAFYAPGRDLNPFAVLRRFATGVSSVEGRCTFRGRPRVVLAHDGDRLYLDAATAMPIKLDRVEPHPTWGQVHVEVVYTTWWRGDGVSVPLATVRYVDGVEHLRRDVALPGRPGDVLIRRIPADTMARPAVLAADHRGSSSMTDVAVPVDTVRVDDATFLLHTRMYTHAVTLQRDTVFLLDATTAEWRARADSAWIARLFPGEHPVVLVVTDLAWPHVGGVRFWAARGATLVSHQMSRPFLEQLLARRWTLAPDALELARRGGAAPPRLVTIDSTTMHAGGAVRLAPIDGGSSEGAVYAEVRPAGFLWAGDYIQDVSAPSQYAQDVLAAAARDGATPRRTAAQHIPLTPWTTVREVNAAP
ncbi:MAG: hypothetical protein KC544_07380 [Gemmatimonadetes bacterium]|nr:hypothetical protein [Gemmatimonadota bacterium]